MTFSVQYRSIIDQSGRSYYLGYFIISTLTYFIPVSSSSDWVNPIGSFGSHSLPVRQD